MLAGCFYPYAPQNTIKTGTQNNETNNSNIINEQIGATATATTTIKHTNHHYYHDDDDENEADLNKNHTEGRKLAPSQATCPRSSSSLSSSVARCNNRISWPSRPQPRPRRLPKPRSSEEPPRPRRSRRDRPPEAAATTEAAFSRPPVSAALAPSQKQNYYPSASILFATATTTRALAYSSALVVFLIIIISINDSNHCYCQQISSTTNHLKATPRSEELAQASSKSIFQPARLNDQNQNQNDPNQRAGRHRHASSPLAVLSSNKRRRRAELVQLESGAHVALPRPLAQVARAAALAAPEARQQQQQDVMPYETFYVTQACEWKSNLFVPKSNDIRFAQQQQQPSSQQPAGWPPPPPQLSQQPDLVQLDQLDDGSRTILSTSQKALVLALPISLGPGFAGYEPACSIRLIVPRNMRILAKLTARRLTFEPEQIVPSQTLPLQANYPYAGAPGSFGGADSSMGPARGSQLWLNVSQNQFSETEQRIIETEGNVLAFRFLLERFANKQVPEIRFQVVLTAFQTFAENSDFNQPTNSIAWPPGGAPNHAHHPAAQPDGAQQNAQLICDSQRLISANLACDGYKNCQDGHDEEPATCLAIRNSQQATGHTVLNGPATATTAITGLSQHDDTAQGRPSESNGGQQRSSWLTQLFNYLTRDSSPLIGFLIGLILLILLLVCCACWCHCLLTLLRHLTSGQTVGPEDDEAGRGSRSSSSRSDSVTRRPLRTAAAEHLSRSSRQQRLRRRLEALRMLAGGGGSAKGRRQTGPHTATRNGRAELEESDSLARGQNIENTARLKARSLLAGGEPTADQPLVGPTAQHQQQQQQQQYRIQSILKRPPPAARGEFKGAPLARFEAIPSGQTGLDYDQSMQYQQQQQQPLPQPPKTPSRHTTTGGPQHYQQQQQQPQQQQTPSPRRGALASSMTSAARSSGRFASALAGAGDFRPTPAARATTASAGGPALSARAGLQAGVRQAQPVAPPPLDSHQLHESRVPSTTYRSHQQPQARIGGGLDGDGRQYDNRQSVVTSRPSVSPRLTDHQAAAGTTTATTPPQQQLQLPPQTPPSASTSDSDRLEFKSKTTKLEQTSTVTGSERVTVYQYSSNLAQFSESYLMKQRQRAPGAAGVGQQPEHAGSPPTSSAHHQEKAISSSSTIATSTTTIRTRAPQPVSGSGAGGDGNNEPQPPELPPKTRQSSLI